MPVLAILMLIDFGLTYYAISADFATEANALMAWLFNLPFIWSLLLRLVMMAAILVPFWLVFRRKERYKRILKLAYIVEGIILLSHSWWLISIL